MVVIHTRYKGRAVYRGEGRVSSLPGGAADKLGNRYESWWTLMRVAHVLEGRATCIRLEPPGDEGSGAEFWIDEPDGRWYEQVKNVQASWTINRLIKEEVLQRLVGHLASGHRIRLVLSTPASDLEELSKRANDADTYTEYVNEFLTNELRKEFRKCRESWGVPEVTAWEYLQRVHIEHYPPENLRRLVCATYERLVEGDPETVVNELRGWLDDMLHQILTAPSIWSHLEGKGFARRLLVGDHSTLKALADTVRRHRRHVDGSLPPIGAVKQPYVTQLVERLSAADSPQVVLLHGKAGSGKSTIAANALRELTSAGWFATAVRMDVADHSAQTAATLGRAFDLSASPSVLLAGVADGSPAVLLVDQLDAVSEYSGRMPDSYDAVLDLLDEVRGLTNIKVVLAVRTVDLNADPRMRALLSDKLRVGALAIGDLAVEEVRSTLLDAGLDTEQLSQTTLQLLCVPLHLAVFSRLSPSAQVMSYRTLPDLYNMFTGEIRRDVERQVGHLDWGLITGPLVRYMSNRECLHAPTNILDNVSQLEVAALVSHGVLIQEPGRFSFFHETYFDFLFGSAFVSARHNLHDFLVESGQNLFRRAQVRQVLEYLAADPDRSEFRRTVVQLLTSPSIRTHLLDVAITVLEQLNAQPDDWQAVEPLAFGDHKLNWRLAQLLSLPQWFDAADAVGRLEILLANTLTVEVAARQLVIAARNRPERVTELVRPYVGASEIWGLRLRALIEWSLRPGLVDLALELIEQGNLDDARGPIAVNSDFWSILYGIHNEDPAGAARLIGAYLRRALKRAQEAGGCDPFESGQLSHYSSAGGASTIYAVASAAPDVFINEVMPFVVHLAQVTASSQVPGELRWGRWRYRSVGKPHGIDDAVFKGIEEALRRLAQRQPEEAAARARLLAASDVDALWFLTCRTLAAAGAGNEAIDWLLSDDRTLGLGWSGSEHWASRELIQVATRSCDEAHLYAFTTRLLEYYPLWERSKDRRRRMWGWTQYELLSAVDPARRSEVVTRRLAELKRRFVDIQLAPPRAVNAGTLRSPIPESKAEFLRDGDWIRAIQKYCHDKMDWSQDPPVGGARELAELLAQRAEAEPERFTRLALNLGVNTPSVHFDRIIEAVAGRVPTALFSQLCAHARRVAGRSVDRAICRAVEKTAADADETLLSLVEQCATDDDPDHDTAQTIGRSGPTHDEENLLTAGLNSTRGIAAQTVARLLFEAPQHANRLTPTVAALATDRVLAVRICAADAVRALMNVSPQIGEDIAANLFAAKVDVFDSIATCNLLQVSTLRDPDRFAAHFRRALEGRESVARRAGRVWAVAFLRGALSGSMPASVTALSSVARCGAAEVFASRPAAVLQELMQLFNDHDEEVREAAATAMRLVGGADIASAQALVASFTTSKAFEDHFEKVFYGLDRIEQLLPEAAIGACERAVEISGKDLGDIRTSRAGVGGQLINILVRLYRQVNDGVRPRVLDVIDKLCETDVHGLREALAQAR